MTRFGPDGGGEYHALILAAERIRREGCEQRRTRALELAARGHRPPAISRLLQQEALVAGVLPRDLDRLGISVHNVRLMLKGRVAA